MSCGTRINGRFGSSWIDRQELAEKLEAEGEYSLARKVNHGDCLDFRELRRAEYALDNQGVMKHFDYKEEQCRCSTEEEY
jgi:hypothetical protein